MFPTIFTVGVAELGLLTGNESGILNMAIVGGAIQPLIQGMIADKIGLRHAFFVPLICHSYILFCGLYGSRPNSERLRAKYAAKLKSAQNDSKGGEWGQLFKRCTWPDMAKQPGR